MKGSSSSQRGGERKLNSWKYLLILLACWVHSSCAVPRTYGAASYYDEVGDMKLFKPTDLVLGDLILLFLSRSDGPLPQTIEGGWKIVASCLKSDNETPRCISCIREGTDGYCETYSDGMSNGDDLGTNVFVKTATEEDLQRGRYKWLLKDSKPTWATIMGVKDVDTNNPIRSWRGTTCDREFVTVFPSTHGLAGDLMLMHMSFDDTAFRSDFGPPLGTQFVSWTKGGDEAEFLFSKTLTEDGRTGMHNTTGPGGPACKDVQMSLVLARAPPSTPQPTRMPTLRPTQQPTLRPTSPPTNAPVQAPQPVPTRIETRQPTPVTTPRPSPKIRLTTRPPTVPPTPPPTVPPTPPPTQTPIEFPEDVGMGVESDSDTVDLPIFSEYIRASPSVSKALRPTVCATLIGGSILVFLAYAII